MQGWLVVNNESQQKNHSDDIENRCVKIVFSSYFMNLVSLASMLQMLLICSLITSLISTLEVFNWVYTYKILVLVFMANFLLQRLEPSSLAQFQQYHMVMELSHSAIPLTVKLNHIPVVTSLGKPSIEGQHGRTWNIRCAQQIYIVLDLISTTSCSLWCQDVCYNYLHLLDRFVGSFYGIFMFNIKPLFETGSPCWNFRGFKIWLFIILQWRNLYIHAQDNV